MRQAIRLMSIGALAFLFTACGSGSNSGGKAKKFSTVGDLEVVDFEEMNEIGSVIEGTDGELTVVDLSKVGSPKAMLLSDLAEDLRIVKLDDAEEALVKSGMMWMSDKRFILYDGSDVKQFDSNGKYLGKIGSKGNGPGEYYIAPYDIAIDETRGRIYLMAYNADKLLSYDLDGKFAGDVPLAHQAKKGFIEIEPDGTLTIGALIFAGNGDDYVVWRQDAEGNMIDGIKAGHLAVQPDFSNEIYKGDAENGFTYSLFRMDAKADTLYNYADGKLSPAFTADFHDNGRMHHYASYPGFYLINLIGDPVQVGEGSFILPSTTPVLIDKKTGKGGAVELVLDFIGPIKANKEWIFAKNSDYFMMNVDPGDFADTLEKMIKEEHSLNESDLASMKELLDGISPDDNNYLIVGKWKK